MLWEYSETVFLKIEMSVLGCLRGKTTQERKKLERKITEKRKSEVVKEEGCSCCWIKRNPVVAERRLKKISVDEGRVLLVTW